MGRGGHAHGGTLLATFAGELCHRPYWALLTPRARVSSAEAAHMGRAMTVAVRVGELRRRPWGAHPQGDPTMREG